LSGLKSVFEKLPLDEIMDLIIFGFKSDVIFVLVSPLLLEKKKIKISSIKFTSTK